MRKDWDTYFIDLAWAASERATCPKRHVGAVLVDHDNHVISTGYNGSKPGEPHCDDEGCLINPENGRCIRTIHAEDNAIRRVGWLKRGGSRLYCTDFPCDNCAFKCVRSGVVEIIYGRAPKRDYSHLFELFEREGIVIRQVVSSSMAE